LAIAMGCGVEHAGYEWILCAARSPAFPEPGRQLPDPLWAQAKQFRQRDTMTHSNFNEFIGLIFAWGMRYTVGSKSRSQSARCAGWLSRTFRVEIKTCCALDFFWAHIIRERTNDEEVQKIPSRAGVFCSIGSIGAGIGKEFSKRFPARNRHVRVGQAGRFKSAEVSFPMPKRAVIFALAGEEWLLRWVTVADLQRRGSLARAPRVRALRFRSTAQEHFTGSRS
jgi:hypothetical protein